MRVCLIGYGYWGKNLARVFGKDLVGICDYNQDNIDKAKELYDVQYFSSWQELYQSDLEYDTVAIATKADTHFELANKFLQSNKNIWLEKPACIKTKDIDEEISAAEEEINNLKTGSGEKIRNIAVETSSELIKQLIGEEANNSSISAIVEEQSRKSREKQNGI